MIVTDSVADIATPHRADEDIFSTIPPSREGPPAPRPGLVLYSEIFQQTAPVRRPRYCIRQLGLSRRGSGGISRP